MIDTDWLRQRYSIDRATIADIADEAGVDIATIHRNLRAAGVPPRGKADARALVEITRAELEQLLGEGLTPHAIGARLGVDHSAVRYQMARHGLLQLTAGQIVEARKAVRLYNRGRSTAAIAAELGRSRRTVGLLLRASGIDLRPPGRPTR